MLARPTQKATLLLRSALLRVPARAFGKRASKPGDANTLDVDSYDPWAHHSTFTLSWGSGKEGKLGHGTTASKSRTTVIPRLNDVSVRALACGAMHTVAIVDSPQPQTVHAWGCNFYSQAGHVSEPTGFFVEDEEGDQVLNPTPIYGLEDFRVAEIASGDFHSLALTAPREEQPPGSESGGGKVYTWGAGLLGHNDEVYDANPQPVRYFQDIRREVVAIGANANYSLAVARAETKSETTTHAPIPTENEVYVWGYLRSHTGELLKALSPVVVQASLGSFTEKAVCGYESFAVLSTRLDDGTRIRTLSVFGLGKREQPRKTTLETKAGWLGWLKGAPGEQDRVLPEHKTFKKLPDYPPSWEVPLLKTVYPFEPILQVPVEITVADLALGPGFVVILEDSGSIHLLELPWASDLGSRNETRHQLWRLGIELPNNARARNIVLGPNSLHCRTTEGGVYVWTPERNHSDGDAPLDLFDSLKMQRGSWDRVIERDVKILAGGWDHWAAFVDRRRYTLFRKNGTI
ncbi:regulator of chromosome condensation 1/beta-lactamase-inhibitor protein II [Polychytrium aggregatum]|uniref:regulator of chromosome condensation 1/beta-lactamase-inhibitor protein II n=1 Tax=Polychytrium aggregatum TaxID=110093 RepID=UPI0022FECB9E|nr:regulator of chromosome condensation 1/beta-lactamase-inhibitor protein II [Polychytrium aggregatum]KAI9193467.1 regulator of chromosome condensation 1/beta-lactamase-inhibitor protein II [Polychytrium aggregatum]